MINIALCNSLVHSLYAKTRAATQYALKEEVCVHILYDFCSDKELIPYRRERLQIQ